MIDIEDLLHLYTSNGIFYKILWLMECTLLVNWHDRWKQVLLCIRERFWMITLTRLSSSRMHELYFILRISFLKIYFFLAVDQGFRIINRTGVNWVSIEEENLWCNRKRQLRTLGFQSAKLYLYFSFSSQFLALKTIPQLNITLTVITFW